MNGAGSHPDEPVVSAHIVSNRQRCEAHRVHGHFVSGIYRVRFQALNELFGRLRRSVAARRHVANDEAVLVPLQRKDSDLGVRLLRGDENVGEVQEVRLVLDEPESKQRPPLQRIVGWASVRNVTRACGMLSAMYEADTWQEQHPNVTVVLTKEPAPGTD